MSGMFNTRVKAILTVVVSAIALASIAFLITVNLSPLLIHYPLGQLHLTVGKIRQDYLDLLAYLQLPWIHQLKFASLPLSGAARSHFAAVKNYFLLVECLTVVSMTGMLILLRKQKRRGQLWWLLTPLKWLLSILLIVLTMLVVNFSSWFIESHYFLFNQMTWLLNPHSDPIILLMPISFFASLFVLWGVLLLVFLIILGMGIWLYLRSLKP